MCVCVWGGDSCGSSHVCGASSGRIQSLCRKHDRIDSGFVLLVFHKLNQAVYVVVKCRKFTKSSPWINECLRAIRAILTTDIRTYVHMCVCVEPYVSVLAVFRKNISHSLHPSFICSPSTSSSFYIMPFSLCIPFLVLVLPANQMCPKRLTSSNNNMMNCVTVIHTEKRISLVRVFLFINSWEL